MAFAKLFELGTEDQLLITKEFDWQNSDEKAQLCFRLRTEKNGVEKSLTLGYKTESMRDAVFNNLTLEDALKIYNALPENGNGTLA